MQEGPDDQGCSNRPQSGGLPSCFLSGCLQAGKVGIEAHWCRTWFCVPAGMQLPEKLYGHPQSQLNHLCTHLYNIVSDTDSPHLLRLKRDRDALLRCQAIDVAEGACKGTLLVDPEAFKSSDFVAVRSKLRALPAEAVASGNAAHLGNLHGEDTIEGKGQQAEQPGVLPASPAAHALQADLGRSTRKRSALSNITNESGKQQRKDQGDAAAGQQTGTAPEHDADRRHAELPVQQLHCGSTPHHTPRTAITHYRSDATCSAGFAVEADLLESCSWYGRSIKMAQRHAERVEAKVHVFPPDSRVRLLLNNTICLDQCVLSHAPASTCCLTGICSTATA